MGCCPFWPFKSQQAPYQKAIKQTSDQISKLKQLIDSFNLQYKLSLQKISEYEAQLKKMYIQKKQEHAPLLFSKISTEKNIINSLNIRKITVQKLYLQSRQALMDLQLFQTRQGNIDRINILHLLRQKALQMQAEQKFSKDLTRFRNSSYDKVLSNKLTSNIKKVNQKDELEKIENRIKKQIQQQKKRKSQMKKQELQQSKDMLKINSQTTQSQEALNSKIDFFNPQNAFDSQNVFNQQNSQASKSSNQKSIFSGDPYVYLAKLFKKGSEIDLNYRKINKSGVEYDKDHKYKLDLSYQGYYLHHVYKPVQMKQFLQYNWSQVQYIDFTNCKINDKQWKMFASNAKRFPNLKFLNLSENLITTIEEGDLDNFKSIQRIVVIEKNKDKNKSSYKDKNQDKNSKYSLKENPLSQQSIYYLTIFSKIHPNIKIDF